MDDWEEAGVDHHLPAVGEPDEWPDVGESVGVGCLEVGLEVCGLLVDVVEVRECSRTLKVVHCACFYGCSSRFSSAFCFK